MDTDKCCSTAFSAEFFGVFGGFLFVFCLYVRMFVLVYTFVCPCIHMSIYVSVCTYMSLGMYVYLHTYTHNGYVYVYVTILNCGGSHDYTTRYMTAHSYRVF